MTKIDVLAHCVRSGYGGDKGTAVSLIAAVVFFLALTGFIWSVQRTP